MAATALGSKAVGSAVKLKVDGVLRDFLVIHQGLPSSLYDSSCNGTWVLMKDIYENRLWSSSNDNDYANSTIHSYLNSTFLNLIDANIRAQIKQAVIPYRPGSGASQSVNSGANGLSAKIFLLSGREVGYTQSNVNQYIINDGAKLAYFQDGNGTAEKTAKLNGSATVWWLRSPFASNPNDDMSRAWSVDSGGSAYAYSCSFVSGLRPAMILPTTLMVNDDGTVTANTAPTVPGSITLPDVIQGGSSITLSWTASTDAQGNLEGYIVERSVDGGASWTQIYQGSALSTTNTVPFGTQSVMYRVKAYDAEGLSSGCRTSAAVTVVNNVAPGVPAHLTIPEPVRGGKGLAVSWGAATDSDGNLDGYCLERRVNGGAWAEVYSGSGLAFTDAITKGWLTVAYRVRAKDSLGLFGDYITSPTYEVDNNTAPVITCALSGNLGEKSAGFTVSYTVGDEENDSVTVTESVDGVPKRSFQADGSSNSFAVTGEYFMKLANGPHTLAIAASDGKLATTHELAFSKLVTAASVTLSEPMEADGPITLCALSVSGGIPADADFQVEVTNNGKDASPVWEDCTTAVRNGINHIFENKTAANGFAFNFRLNASRGTGGQGGYITSIQGGFQ